MCIRDSLKSEHELWHADGSYGGAWREEVNAALEEMERVLSDGGVAVVLETQGTATEVARREGAHLYAHLRARGFEHKTIRTDYRFASKREALRTLSFFFGRGASSSPARRLRSARFSRDDRDANKAASASSSSSSSSSRA